MLQAGSFAVYIKVKGKPGGHFHLILPPQLGFKDMGRPGSASSIDEGELQGITGGKGPDGTHRQLLLLVFDPGWTGIKGLAVKPGAFHRAVGKEKIIISRLPGKAPKRKQQDKSNDFLIHLRLIKKVNPCVSGLAPRLAMGVGCFRTKVSPSGR